MTKQPTQLANGEPRGDGLVEAVMKPSEAEKPWSPRDNILLSKARLNGPIEEEEKGEANGSLMVESLNESHAAQAASAV